MSASPPFGLGSDETPIQILREDGERALCRIGRDGQQYAFVPTWVSAGHASPEGVRRLLHEFGLKEHLDSAWSLRPLELVRERGRTLMVIDYPGGEWLDLRLGAPIEIPEFLRIAISLAGTLGRMHGRGLVHKELKPSNVLFDPETYQAWLTGFGIASRLPRERQSPDPPEFIAGTLAYMSPEQTGRMNRSIDSRSDLYSLGILLYEMLTGELPFTADDPMEWVHCHVARQPVPPHQRLTTIPIAVSAIAMKLLAKTAEDRYQTAAGAERDLRRCLDEWQATGRIDDFVPGKHDTPDWLLIPERLYGRELEIETLLNAFDRTVAGGKPELILVSGYSGIGKSAVVNELHKWLVPPRGLFASGKFDQFKRDIPYATLAQAFQSLIRPLLSKSEDEVLHWREALRTALDPNGQLIIDLVPELRHIIGEQPPVPELPPQDAQGRFQLVFRRFIDVFARPEHPLALFLDDLQWLDAATLDLLEDLLTRPELHNLLLIGAYRDNEVTPTHPLARKLDVIRQAGAAMRDIVLKPLNRADLETLLGDSLHCTLERAAPLASLLHEKTSGNPFFAIQFVLTLAEEGLLAFDYETAQWSWDLNRIHAKGYTDNVVELMVGKLSRLSAATQEALQEFACMGNSAEFDVLQMVCQRPVEEMHAQFWEAVLAGLIYRSENAYRFLHDRVQEAAYSQISPDRRAETHLHIGTLLAAHTPKEKQEEAIFEIVNQLNRGAHLITTRLERERVADLNLLAGRRAKSSTAYASALKYLRAGKSVLAEDAWDSNYTLAFAIEYLMSECELLTAELSAAEDRLSALAELARTRHDFSIVTRLRLTLYTTLDRSDRGVEVFLDYLRRSGTRWSPHPSREEVMREYEKIWANVGARQIEELLDLPFTADRDVLDMLDVFSEMVTPALFYDENFSSLVVCRMVNLSLEHGNCDASCFGYVWFAMFAGPRFGNYKDGFRFGQLGYDLVEQRGLTRYEARTLMSFGNLVIPWARHVASGRELVRRAFDAAYRIGDLTFAAYSWDELITNSLAVGDPLADIQTEAENGLEFAKRVRFGMVVDLCAVQLGLIRTLRGLTPRFGCFDDADFNEFEYERHLASNPVLAIVDFFYRTRKLQVRFFANDYASAVDASLKAQTLQWTSPSQLETADFRFYGALAHAAAWNAASAQEREGHVEALMSHHEQLETWAVHCPANFENRAALVAAEIARIQGRLLDAEHLYEVAIQSSHSNGFIHNEAVANEVAARFYEGRGFDKVARAYLRDAQQCYLHWGADAKVRQLDERYPNLRGESQRWASKRTILTSVEQLDLATVIKVSQAVSGETQLDKLIDMLIRTAIEHAGAQRGLLILPRDEGHRIGAEATIESEGVRVNLRQSTVSVTDLPMSVFQYVLRTREGLLLHDASNEQPFDSDDYIRRQRAHSILCLPLLKQTRLIGVLYLENNLTRHVFTPARMAVLKLLASEAAISLENARLYGELQTREARVRRLFDSNIIGIFLWHLDGRIIDANEALLRITGYDHRELVSGYMRWREMIPEEWRDVEQHSLSDLDATGVAQPLEMEYFKKDGSRVPVLVGAAIFDGVPDEGVAFVVDLTDLKRAEEAARDSERRFHEVHVELAHANRIASVGQLSASIAHEVNQPLTGIITNANTCLRMLTADPANVEGAQETARRTIRDANRASEVVSRLRAMLAKKPPASTDAVDLNDAVREVIALSSGSLQKSRVILRLHCSENLPLVRGHRVPLQQVMLNLILNASDAMSSIDGRPRELIVTTENDQEDDSVRIAVRDSGTGFDPGTAEKMFSAFYTTKSQGMGMGLSISRSIVESHNGRLWATLNDGPGATFCFSIPLRSGAGPMHPNSDPVEFARNR